MTRTVRVDLGERGYDVVICSGTPDGIHGLPLPQGESHAVIADSTALGLHGESLMTLLRHPGQETVPVIGVDPGEQSKSWEWASKCCDFLADNSLGRRDTVVSIGGGVVSDLAGFVAAIYLRGVRYISFPTTLLAQIDASVGGKTAIDIEAGKNLVGAFHQPSLVVADVSTLRTLPAREFRAGMAEVVKHGLIKPEILAIVRDNLAELAKGPAADPELLAELVAENVRCKADVVMEDERESGVRAHLNLGHTFAHALEAGLGYGNLLHGEAVAMGLVAACNLASRLGLADGGLQAGIEKLLVEIGLPIRIPPCDLQRVLVPMSKDKKSVGGKLRFVLASVPGDVFIEGDVPIEAVLATLEELKDDENA